MNKFNTILIIILFVLCMIEGIATTHRFNAQIEVNKNQIEFNEAVIKKLSQL